MNEVSNRPLLGTGMKEVVLPCIRATIEMARDRPHDAIEALRPAVRYDLGQDSGGMTLYYRGLAHLQLGQPTDAIAQFQAIVDHRGIAMTDVYWPLAHLGLARAYALAGENDKSLAYYRELLTFWKSADPELRIAQQAKSEYVKLSDKRFNTSR